MAEESKKKHVREPVAAYAPRSDAAEIWEYDPRQLIPIEQIEALAYRIAERFEVEKILLFGSYAYGAPQEGSDVDLLVIMDHDEISNRKQMLKVCQALYPRWFPLDIIVRRPKDIVERIPQGDWMLKEAYEQGKVLYERT
jgi:predicted nucleotidyltransferase